MQVAKLKLSGKLHSGIACIVSAHFILGEKRLNLNLPYYFTYIPLSVISCPSHSIQNPIPVLAEMGLGLLGMLCCIYVMKKTSPTSQSRS